MDMPSILSHVSRHTAKRSAGPTMGRFHEAAMATGATDDGAPGPRPEYGDDYGCFTYDPDGHKIEASTVPGTT